MFYTKTLIEFCIKLHLDFLLCIVYNKDTNKTERKKTKMKNIIIFALLTLVFWAMGAAEQGILNLSIAVGLSISSLIGIAILQKK